MNDPKRAADAAPEQDDPTRLSRRKFLKGASAFIAAASISTVAGCAPEPSAPAVIPEQPVPTGLQYPEVPPTPLDPPDPTALRFFTPHEARTVDALTSRLLPGTPDDPGAHEAGVTTYIDYLLSQREGFAEAIYRDGPYAEIYEGEAPPTDGQFNVIYVSAEDIERYGYQSILTPREVYRLGLAAVDRHGQGKHGKRFIELSETEQDGIIQDMVDGKATTFAPFGSTAFFHTLRRHTAEGMFSDPVYGGNRGMVGWRLIGYPGAQRAYTEQDIRTEAHGELIRPPQSIQDLSHFHPGQPAGPHVVLPVSGSEHSDHDRSKNDPFWPREDKENK